MLDEQQIEDPPVKKTSDGLPILTKKTSTTEDGLPILKKKEATTTSSKTNWDSILSKQDSFSPPTTTQKDKTAPLKDRGSWANLPTFGAREIFGGLEKDLGNLFGFIKDKVHSDPITKIALGEIQDFWRKGQEKDEAVSALHQLPNTTGGHIASAVTKFIPDLIELAATPELDIAKLGKLGTFAAKGGKLGTKVAQAAVGKFPIQQATKTMLQDYSDAKEKGEDPNVAAIKGLAEGYKNGVIFEGAGEAAGKLTKLGTEALEKTGLMAGNKLVAGAEKRLLHATAQGITFSAANILQNAVEGRGTGLNEIKHNWLFGTALGGITGHNEPGEISDADKAAAQVIMRKPLVDLHNFANADMDNIKFVHGHDVSAEDLQANSAAHAEDGFKATGPDEKAHHVLMSSIYGKASSIKSITQAILKDKQGVIDEVSQLDLPDEAKQGIVDKINQVHKELDPTEQKKTELGTQIADIDRQATTIQEKSDDPVKQAENEVKLDDLKKQREEASNNLKQLIIKQNESNQQKSVAERPADVSESQETQNKDKTEVGDARDGKEGDEGQKRDVKLAGGDEPPVTKPTDKTTGIKKAISEATRIQRNLPPVELPKLGKDSETLAKGKKSVDEGTVDPAKIAQDVVNNKRDYTPEEEAPAMLYYGHQLAKEETRLREQLEAAKDDPQARALLHNNLQQLNDKIDLKTQADRIASRAWSNSGNIKQIEVDESFSPANIRSIIKENYGGKIPKEVEERISKAEQDRDMAIAELKKATESQITKEGAKTVEKIRKSINLVKQSKAELQEEATKLVEDLKKALRQDSARMNSGIPLPTETLAVLGKLAVNYFKQGIKDFEGLANKIYDDLKDTGVNKQDIREYLSNYEPIRDEAREKEMQRLGTKERSINKQLETGNIRDYSRKPKIVFKKDSEVIKAEQRVADAEYKLKQEKSKSYKSTEGKYQRGLNWIIRWERRSVLASPLILEKLASAATIGAAVNRIPKQLIGGAFSAIFKGLSKKAMIEGGLNMDAELKYWKEFTDPKKFAKNAVEILKTGASPLTRQFSEKAHEHYAGYDALMDLHSIIKDPPKRATFEASLRYAYDWAAKQGLDYQDPLVKRSLELAAFKRAEYEIFQENNGIAKRVSDFINSERQRNNAEATKKFLYKFLIPISTVPLNIARRIGSSIAGLPHGLYLTREAYKKGIDNLTPEQADYIMRQLKNGSVGLAYFTVGLFASKSIMGGVWNADDKKGKKALPNQAGYDEMKPFGHPIDKRIQHAMPLFLMQLGATTARVYNHYMDVPTDNPEYQTMLKSVAKSMMATTGAVAGEIPMINEPVHAYEALKDPQERDKFGEDMKRRIGFSIAQDLGITQKDTKTPLDKKLSTVTNDDGDKVSLTATQQKQRKELFNRGLKDNSKDWTEEYNDEWESDKNVKSREKLSTYWHSINRSDDYIRKKFADMKQDGLDKYLEKQAVEYSAEEMQDKLKPVPVAKNKYTIK